MPHFDACISLRQASTSAGFMPTARHRWYRHRLQLVRVILFTYRNRVLIYGNGKEKEEEKSLPPNFPPRFLPIYLISENFPLVLLTLSLLDKFQLGYAQKKKTKSVELLTSHLRISLYYDLLLDSISRASLFF